jgi:hypothetical protein
MAVRQLRNERGLLCLISRQMSMKDAPDHDPLRKSWRESDRFNFAWLRNGEKLTWTQRIGFAVFSFIIFSSCLLFETLSINSLLHGELLSADTLIIIFGIAAGLVMLILGLFGLRNVLRF